MGASIPSPLPEPSQHADRRLRLYLLGGFRAQVDGKGVAESSWARRSARALVKLLAIEPSHRLHREQIIDLLWPEAGSESGLNSFSKALHSARRALEPTLRRGGDSSYLQTSGETLSLVTSRVWIDVDHFRFLADKALDTRALSDFEAALTEYPGELLPEDRYEEWTAARRDELRELFLRLLAGMADALERHGSFEPAAERLRRILTYDPAREEVHRRLMRLHVLSGNRHEAVRQYESCRATLRSELDAQPEPETERLYQDILTGKLQPAAASADRPVPSGERSALPPAIRRAPALPLVGRDRVLEILMADLAHAAEGNGGMVLVGGEAGVGKSRLNVEAARAAHHRGALVLWGAGYEQEGLLPYGPFVEALDCYVADRTTEERTALAGSFPELVPLLPSLPAGTELPWTDGSPGARARLFRAAVRLLTDLADVRPVLLVIEDLHAADTESLGLLHHLARAATQRRWLIVATYREEDVEVGSELQRLSTAVTREGLCRRIDLRRLGREDSQDLVQSLLGEGDAATGVAEQLYALSLGNPLFLQELVRTMREQEALRREGDTWRVEPIGSAVVPGEVQELVARRVDRLDEPARRVLALAATAGMECSLAVLRAAATVHASPRLSEGELLEALDQALESRVLEERGEGFAFGHPLLRATLYERLPRHRRLAYHGALGTAIEQLRPEEVEALAYHFGRSDHEEKAVLYLERAGDRARLVQAHDVAEHHYRELLERLRPAADPTEAARVREKLGRVLRTKARYDEAIDILEQAADVYRRQEQPEGEARAAAEIGRVHFLRGTAAEGIARITPLLHPLEDGGQFTALAPLQAALASLYWAAGSYHEQLAAARQAADLARSAADQATLVEAELWYGYALLALQQVDDGMRVLENVVSRAEAAGDLLSLSRALSGLAADYSDRGDFERERSYLEQGLEVAEALGDPARVAFMSYRYGINRYLWGDWQEARVHLERAVELSHEIGESRGSPEALFALGRLCLRVGEVDTARRHLEECITAAERTGSLPALRGTHSLLAEYELLEGRPEEALARLDRLLRVLGIQEEAAGHLLPILAWTRLETAAEPEDIRRAEELAAKSIAQARAEENRVLLVDALQVQSLIAIREGRWDEAARALDEALDLTREMHYPYAEARLLHLYGIVYGKKGDAGAERDALLRQALAILQRLGAQPDAARVERGLE